MDARAEKIALFRYGLIAPLVLEPLPRGELTRRAEEIASRHYEIPGSNRMSISVDAQGRCDGAGSENRLQPPAWRRCAGGHSFHNNFLPLSRIEPASQPALNKKPHFLW